MRRSPRWTTCSGREAAIGAVYAFVAYGLFRYFESAGRRRASLETL